MTVLEVVCGLSVERRRTEALPRTRGLTVGIRRGDVQLSDRRHDRIRQHGSCASAPSRTEDPANAATPAATVPKPQAWTVTQTK